MKKWKKKYQCLGKLNVEKCKKFVENLEMKAMFKTGKVKPEREILSAREWFEGSVRRQEGIKRKKYRIMYKSLKIMVVCRQENNKTTPVVRTTAMEPDPIPSPEALAHVIYQSYAGARADLDKMINRAPQYYNTITAWLSRRVT